MRQTERRSDHLHPRAALVVATLMGLAMAIADVATAEEAARRQTGQPWSAALAAVSDALAAKNVGAADRAWRDAYGAALGSRTWVGMAEVGDAALRIGDATPLRKPYEAKARDSYLTALFRARSQGSLDGVLRIAQAFEALGDREVVKGCIRIAERVAMQTRDIDSRDRVKAFAARFSERPAVVSPLRTAP